MPGICGEWFLNRFQEIIDFLFIRALAARPVEPAAGIHAACGHALRRRGARMCPGRYLSLVEMKMLLAMLLHHFELEEVRGPGGTPVREHYAFSMRPQAWKRR